MKKKSDKKIAINNIDHSMKNLAKAVYNLAVVYKEGFKKVLSKEAFARFENDWNKTFGTK